MRFKTVSVTTTSCLNPYLKFNTTVLYLTINLYIKNTLYSVLSGSELIKKHKTIFKISFRPLLLENYKTTLFYLIIALVQS